MFRVAPTKDDNVMNASNLTLTDERFKFDFN